MSLLQKSRLQKYSTATGVFAIIAACFFIPISTSLMGFFSLLAMLCWIISGKILQLPQHMADNPAVLMATLLFTMFVVGLSYSSAPLSYAFEILIKYRELLFIPVVVALLREHEKRGKMAENAFISGCICLLIISFLLYFSVLPPLKHGNSVLHHITHSFFMAVLSFFAMNRLIDSRQYRYFWLLIYLATIINIIYIAPGRTGMIVFILLMILLLFQRFSLPRFAAGLVIVLALVTTAFYTSENVSSGLTKAVKEVQQYTPGVSRTSLGMRFDWWYNSVDLIKLAPLFGHGTGSFMLEQQTIKNENTKPTDNPHNEYLFIGAQLGLVGLFFWLLLLVAQLAGSRRMEQQHKYIVQGIVLAMASGCLMNSFLFDSHQGHFYAIISAIYFAALPGKSTISGGTKSP